MTGAIPLADLVIAYFTPEAVFNTSGAAFAICGKANEVADDAVTDAIVAVEICSMNARRLLEFAENALIPDETRRKIVAKRVVAEYMLIFLLVYNGVYSETM